MKFKFDIQKSEEYIRNIICGLMVVILGFLFVESFMHTMVLTSTKERWGIRRGRRTTRRELKRERGADHVPSLLERWGPRQEQVETRRQLI